jgi:RNA polymerase sigma-70 factor (ECF subfamily)
MPRLRRFALGLTGSQDRADDLVQASYERALRETDKWVEGTRLDAWMFRILRNIFLNQMRSERLQREKSEEFAGGQESVLDGERFVEAQMLVQKVRLAVTELPEEQRTALLLITVEGFSYREVSDLTGDPVGTIASRVARARETLMSDPNLKGRLEDRTTVKKRGAEQ